MSDLGDAEGTITYVFANPVSISRMLVWNAYFDFELDHSIRNVQLVFRDVSNAIITTQTFNLPIANPNVLTPYVANLTAEVLGVKRVQIVVNTLWGGNEISVRRIAFAGNGLTTATPKVAAPEAPVLFPNPATGHATLLLPGITSLLLIDATGRQVPVQLTRFNDRAELAWGPVPAGIYTLIATGDRGPVRGRIVVE